MDKIETKYLLEKTITNDGLETYTIYDEAGYTAKIIENKTEAEALEIFNFYANNQIKTSRSIIKHGRTNQKSYSLSLYHSSFLNGNYELTEIVYYAIHFNKTLIHTLDKPEYTEDAAIELYEQLISIRLSIPDTISEVIKTN